MLRRDTLIQRDDEPRANVARRELDRYVGHAHKTYTPTQLVVARAEGCWLETLDGARLLDFTSGVLVANLGHGNPAFEEAYTRYTNGVPRNCYNAVSPLEPKAAGRLISSLNAPKLQKLLWADSGSAAIIKAIWAAQRSRPDKRILLATRFGFHGKKGLAGDVTGSTSPNPNVRFVSFPMDEVADVTMLPDAEADRDRLLPRYAAELDALKREFGDEILLLITEPYLGAAGSFHPTKWYMRFLAEWCAANDVLFVLDEVQACHGRTGNLFAYQTYGVEPDLVALGKGLGNGESVAVVAGRPDLIESLDYGEASDTYSGNPRACGAALAALDVFESQPVMENCRARSAEMQAGLTALRDEFPFVKHVRGEGLVWGIEMDAYGGMSADEVARQAVLECYRAGLHLLGPLAGKVLRVSPPLVIAPEELAEGLNRMRRGFGNLATGR